MLLSKGAARGDQFVAGIVSGRKGNQKYYMGIVGQVGWDGLGREQMERSLSRDPSFYAVTSAHGAMAVAHYQMPNQYQTRGELQHKTIRSL